MATEREEEDYLDSIFITTSKLSTSSRNSYNFENNAVNIGVVPKEEKNAESFSQLENSVIPQ